MATYGLDDVSFILIDGYQVAGYINEFSDDREATLEDSTCCGDSWEEWAFTGEKRCSASMKGFFDDADNASNEAFVDQYAARIICYGMQGNTAGKQLSMLSGPMQSKYVREAARGALTKGAIEIAGSGEIEDGRIVATLTARTTAGNTAAASVNNGGSSAAGGAVYLQCTSLALGGYTNLVVKLQDSADNITFGDVAGGTFTALIAAPGKERKALSGTIKQYTAVAWSWTGSGSDQTATFLVGLHRN